MPVSASGRSEHVQPRADGALARLRRRLAGGARPAGDLERSGRLDAALEQARADGDVKAVRRIEGELRTLDPSWLPATARTSAGAVRSPAPGRVLNLLESSLPHVTAGYAQRARAVCAAQRRCGLAPTVATRLGFPASRGIAFQPVERVDGVDCHRFWIDGLRHYTAVPRDRQIEIYAELAAQLAEDICPALIWAATPHLNGLVGLALRERLNVPLVYDVRGFPDLTWLTGRGGMEHAARLRAAEARCMREADAVVTLSATMRDEAVARGAQAERVHVLPHAVETGAAVAADADAVELRRHLGLEGRMVVGHASTLRSYEGADVLLRAVALAREARDDLACMVMGDGPARAELEPLADDLGVGAATVFAGRVPSEDMAAHYAACDMLAVPRLAAPVCEGVTPLKVVEAMAAGRCVVASALSPLEEATAGAARLVAPGDPGELARALLELAVDTDERARLGRRAREVAGARNAPAELDAAVRRLIAALGVEAASDRVPAA